MIAARQCFRSEAHNCLSEVIYVYKTNQNWEFCEPKLSSCSVCCGICVGRFKLSSCSVCWFYEEDFADFTDLISSHLILPISPLQSYYNKDTIESIRQGRGLSDVTDPSDALYTSVNSSTPTLSQQHNNTDSFDDDHLGNREEFLSGSTAKLLSAESVDVSGAREGYYNVKHRVDDSDREEEGDYYNSVSDIGASSNQPLLNPEDNQYIYIENSDVTRASGATVGKPAVATKPRHLSSPVAQPKKKYINLGPNQRQILQGKVQVTAVNPTTDETTHVQVANGGSIETGLYYNIDDSSDQPLYENLREDEEVKGDKEIYENIVRWMDV